MKKLLKKSISVLLAAVLLLTVIPFAAAAAEPDRGGAFTVVATSNFFPEKRESYSDLSKYEDENGDVFITVEYKLKADHQIAWVAAMNSIQNRAEEIVLSELVYE